MQKASSQDMTVCIGGSIQVNLGSTKRPEPTSGLSPTRPACLYGLTSMRRQLGMQVACSGGIGLWVGVGGGMWTKGDDE
jgi:hypothetical protein